MPRSNAHPFSFVLSELEESPLAPRVRTNPMFGSLAVYVGERIVFILRRKDNPASTRDDGVWVAMQPEHVTAFRQSFPIARPIEMFAVRSKTGFAGWLNLPCEEEGFEESVLGVCRLVIQGDARLGKVPKPKAKRPRV